MSVQTTEQLVESRTMVAFRGRDEDLNAELPEGWTVSAWPSGPSAGANMLAVFAERLLGSDARGEPLPDQATLQQAVVAVRAAHADGRAGLMILFGLWPLADAGPYGVFKQADARIIRVLRSGPAGIRCGEEDWSFSTPDGERLSLQINFERGRPTRESPSPQPVRAYSPVIAGFWRQYDNLDQGIDLLMSVPLGRNALSFFHFEAQGPRLDALFGRSEQISATSLPWMIRRVSVP